jgi:hypothetical protein
VIVPGNNVTVRQREDTGLNVVAVPARPQSAVPTFRTTGPAPPAKTRWRSAARAAPTS